ncbi:tetratricopeptide repeat protein [Segatella baroniae]|uniref:tetratricopeptide repeat protein n=1 Tax=Segatella baroniae TaxID=305719 RepID=UPI000AFCD298|nr:SEL1-like repeat protein [Segatella baroniae]
MARSAAKAFECYQLSAQQGNDCGQYNLGVCYYNGESVPKDMQKAVHWFRLAADQGYEAAIEELAEIASGLYLWNGDGPCS